MVTRFETWDDPEPEGAGHLWYDAPPSYVRSTADSLFEWQGPFDRRALYDTTPGTVWTNEYLNYVDFGDMEIEGAVTGAEVVTVPAGTIACTRCDLSVIGTPTMTCTDWVKHDLGLVKRVISIPNLIGSASPLTYELQSIKR
jgi:hypothetical protein